MNRVNTTLGALGLLTAGAVASFGYSAPAAAQGLVDSYAVKVVCRDRDDDKRQVLSGNYMTSVNIYNPHDFPIEFSKKASRARPMRGNANPNQDISPESGAALRPMQATSMDCEDMRRLYEDNGLPFGAFYEGFLVVLVPAQAGFNEPPQVDVQAVYTAEKRIFQGGEEMDVETIDVETVKPIRTLVNSGELADLVPVPDQNGFFCRLNAAGELVVETLNQGAGAAGGSRTFVDFLGFGTQTQAVPALGAGVSTTNAFPIPLGCYNPDCNFRIFVDSDGTVSESDEANNFASGFCLG